MADASAKKRKRASNGIETPSKKTTTQQAASGNITVSHVDAEGMYPVVAVSNGITPPAITFDAYSKPIAGTTDVLKPSSHNILLQSSKHARLDYTATPPADGLAHYIALYDPAAGSMKVVPVHHTRLNAVLRTEPVDPEATPKKTMLQQRTDLGQEFGTKKAKKAIASRTVNAITSGVTSVKAEDAQKALLEDVAQLSGKAVSEKEQQKLALAAKPIPQPNLDAETVEQVYPLETLVPPSDMRLIEVDDWIKMAKDEVNGVKWFHRFPTFRVTPLVDDIEKLKALRYMALLLQFHSALIDGRVKKVRKRDELKEKVPGYNEALLDSVRKRFSTDRQELGKFQMDMLYTHICALALFVDNYTTNTNDLRQDLGLDQSTLNTYFTELGAGLRKMTEAERLQKGISKAEAGLIYIARLPRPPIQWPKVRSGRRK